MAFALVSEFAGSRPVRNEIQVVGGSNGQVVGGSNGEELGPMDPGARGWSRMSQRA